MTVLRDATVVITGAGRGLGAALAMTLADMGSRVVVCGRSLDALSVTREIIKLRTGVAPDVVALDLADASSIDAAVKRIGTLHSHIDVLINNAATWLESTDKPHSTSEVLDVIGATVSGTFLVTQSLLPLLQRSRRPDIVMIGSDSALPNAPVHSLSVPFYAAKHAQAALAEGFRQTLSRSDIRSICVHPPDLDDVLPSDLEWNDVPKRINGERATSRDVVEAVIFALTRPRHITVSTIVLAASPGK